MSINDTAKTPSGVLVMDYDPRTASFTAQVLTNSGGFEAVRDGTAVAASDSDAQAAAEFVGKLTARPGSVCPASVQHNYRAGPHPGNCQRDSGARR
jgi:predicted chitinase